MAVAADLPEGLVDIAEVAIFAEVDDIENDEAMRELADLVIRMTGVIVRFAAQQPTWTVETIPLEARVVALNFARRVLNNPQVQQRITTGPIGEAYSTDELTGLELKDSEEALLATFIDGAEGDLGGLSIISVVREDPLMAPMNNRDLAPLYGLGRNDALLSIPSLSKYLGIPYGS